MIFKDRFYGKVQGEVLNLLLAGRTVYVSMWDSETVYLSDGGSVFYLVPYSKFYLDKSLIRSCDELFKNGCRYVMELYSAKLVGFVFTGVRKSMQVEKDYLIECAGSSGRFYLRESFMKKFPGNVRFYLQDGGDGSVLVLTLDGEVLGGIQPVVYSSKE